MVDGQTLEMGARRTSTFWPAAAAGNTVCRVRWSTVPPVPVVGASGRRVVPVGPLVAAQAGPNYLPTLEPSPAGSYNYYVTG